ncbi:MAG: NYN domain-containing protein [Candidatus Diapherotrites archaeon]|nr:NYN domain-containing protein [Candidatus Diapherotrites archaeon]
MERIGVFIDNAYFEKACRNLGVPRVDYLQFSEELCRKQGGKRFRTYVYDCMPFQSNPPTEKERERYSKKYKFRKKLERLPKFVTRWGHLKKTSQQDKPFQQKGVDILLAIDLVKLSWTGKIDTAVLVSGDSDYAPAVGQAKEANVLTILYYDGNTYVHDELFDLSDDREEITKELLEKCGLDVTSCLSARGATRPAGRR